MRWLECWVKSWDTWVKSLCSDWKFYEWHEAVTLCQPNLPHGFGVRRTKWERANHVSWRKGGIKMYQPPLHSSFQTKTTKQGLWCVVCMCNPFLKSLTICLFIYRQQWSKTERQHTQELVECTKWKDFCFATLLDWCLKDRNDTILLPGTNTDRWKEIVLLNKVLEAILSSPSCSGASKPSTSSCSLMAS